MNPSRSNPTPPQQFMKLFYYMHAEYLESFLRTKELKLTDLSDTNDPFEVLPALAKKDMKGPFGAYLSQAIMRDTELLAHSIPMIASCMSRLVTSPALWGHYANCHKGVCLVFNCPIHNLNEENEILSGIFHDGIEFRKVKYRNARMEMTAEQFNFTETGHFDAISYMNAMTFKGMDWAWEQEYRFIFYYGDVDDDAPRLTARNGMYFTKAFFPYLEGIILGMKSPLRKTYLTTLIQNLLDEFKTQEDKEKEDDKIKVYKKLLQKGIGEAKKSSHYFRVENSLGLQDTKELKLS